MKDHRTFAEGGQMKKCPECGDIVACSMCRLFNPGYCVLHDEDRHKDDMCTDFICINYKVEHPRFEYGIK